MGLLLNGEEFKMSDEDIAKYSKSMKFYVGKSFITRRKPDPDDSREFDVGRVAVPAHYYLKENRHRGTGNFKEKDQVAKVKQGRLEYYDTFSLSEDGKRKICYPPAITIGGDDKGHIVVDALNYELNYFLDNHPNNEMVITNPKHPHYDPKNEALLCTFVARKVAQDNTDYYEKKALIMRILTSKSEAGDYDKCDSDQLKAMAISLLRGAGTAGIDAGLLTQYDTAEEDVLRFRMCQMAERYPFNVYKAYLDLSSDYAVDILEWQKLGVMVLEGNSWVFKEWDSTRKHLVEVPEGRDAIEALVTYLEQEDLHGKMLTKIKAAADVRLRSKQNERGKKASVAKAD